MRNFLFFIIIISLVLPLAGCLGAKTIEGEVYITAVGIDYKKGKFEVYIQGLNFGNIAKQEGAEIKELPTLIGEEDGESLHTAYAKLEQVSAFPLSLGHVHTFILSKNVIKEKMADVMDLIGHSPNLRYNMFIFGTEENLKELLQTQTFFNFPQLYSILHRPEGLIRQNYALPILKYNQFTSRYYRPIGTILIPSLVIDKEHFSEKEEKRIAILNGEYLFSQQHYKGWLNIKDLRGLKWFSKDIQEFTIREGTRNVAVKIKNPKTKIMVIKGKQPSYRIEVKGRALLYQNKRKKSNREIEKEIKTKIKDDILTTIKNGDQLDTDILNISEKSYKYHLNQWDTDTIRSFNEKSIKEIKVMIQIKDSGKYK